MTEEVSRPKTFISYSRTDADHIKWVVDLATELKENGVEVVLDKWHLQKGQDLHAFMEQAVNDPEMDKVIVICDEEYARKADEREGGVGTETQIISQDLYDEVDPQNPQQKFAAVVTEKDEEGDAYLPTYLGGRLYIDMSTPDLRLDNFEQLLRWLYDQPVSEEPEQGEPPQYLFQDEAVELGTRSRAKRAKKMLRDGDSAARGALREYFDTYAKNLERFQIDCDGLHLPPEEVLESIENFLPARNEAVDVFTTLATYWPGEEAGDVLHRFFEDLLPYLYGQNPRQQKDTTADNFAFVIRELFLYAVAALLKERRFEGVDLLMSRGYYLESERFGVESGLKHFTEFRAYLRSLEKHLEHRRVNKTSDLLEERSGYNDISHDDLMQADLLLYLRAEIDRMLEKEAYVHWHPDTLTRSQRRSKPFELFRRASSESNENLLQILNIPSRDDFVAALSKIQDDRGFPTFDGWPVEVPRLVGIPHDQIR
jgi:hypothetical protein